ncbi:MAG: hypothetical protein ACLGG0_11035 [Bacteriovoracia bacterium]
MLEKMMAQKIPNHIDGLLKYLSQPEEKANEDLIIKYFREVYPEFSRQKEAKRADGYVPGQFVLELKGKQNDWYAGLFQGVAYQRELDFSLVIVAAKHFLAVWKVSDLPASIREEILLSKDAPNEIGKKFATKYRKDQIKLLKKSIWMFPSEFLEGLFSSKTDVLLKQVKEFELIVQKQKKVRHKITVKNFPVVLKEMVQFFDKNKPMMVVRAFYSMLFGWNENSTLEISHKINHQATLGGEAIDHLIPGKRMAFKEFVENHYIYINEGENEDDFFAMYDTALDTVDSKFRSKHGIFFTDLTLSKFAMWFVRKHLGDIGKNHLVIDPACGSGNLITNWKSPLELRHKVVSEIEPELLFIVEKRMKSDAWHEGKFTVVPKVNEGKGLNFIDISAKEYLGVLTKYLNEKGQKPDKPLAILCNPPYKNDDDQSDGEIDYQPHSSIVELIGKDTSGERSNCFLAQMKLLAEAAEEKGLPGQTLLMLFTGIPWLTSRPVHRALRDQIVGNFEDVSGFMVNSKEYFDVPGKFPVAFTIWRYRGPNAGLDVNRSIPLLDLTWLSKKEMQSINWDDKESVDKHSEVFLADKRSIAVEIGKQYQNIREWSGQKRFDFQREKTKDENEQKSSFLCGLPKGDGRHSRKKTLGHSDGTFIGFVDDLTPCRIRKGSSGFPWFRLNTQFMEFQKTRCFSGPADNRAFTATDELSAKKMFFWYSMNRSFKHIRYPMWANNFEMWGISNEALEKRKLTQLSFSIAIAENECVETLFPANNPVKGSPEIYVPNPLSPNDKSSFWTNYMDKYFSPDGKSDAEILVRSVKDLFLLWKKRFKKSNEIYTSYKCSYFVGDGILRSNSGIVQIQDYAEHTKDTELLKQLDKISEQLKLVKEEFNNYLLKKDGLNYFDISNLPQATQSEKPLENVIEFIIPSKTAFEKVLEKRLAIAHLITSALSTDPNLGRVKFAKAFYLLDEESGLDLKTEYTREIAGPLDQRSLYNETIGVEALGQRYNLFEVRSTKRGKGEKISYLTGKNASIFDFRAKEIIGAKAQRLDDVISIIAPLNTDQVEIVATLYACWKDILLSKKALTTPAIIDEFRNKWHKSKKRFNEKQLSVALDWMKEKGIVPSAKGKRTKTKDRLTMEDIPF